MKRRGFTYLQAFVLMAVVIGAAFFILPVFTRISENAHKSSCQSNQKKIALGFKQYVQDWDEKLPQVNVKDIGVNENNPFGWADALQPYIKSNRIFHCPDRHHAHDKKPTESGYSDYFYNRRLAGINYDRLKFSAAIILTGDGNDGTDATNARYSLSTLPTAWRTNKDSPAYRHLDGANYAFADGHVKWLKPEKIIDAKPNGNNFTFTIR